MLVKATCLGLGHHQHSYSFLYILLHPINPYYCNVTSSNSTYIYIYIYIVNNWLLKQYRILHGVRSRIETSNRAHCARNILRLYGYVYKCYCMHSKLYRDFRPSERFKRRLCSQVSLLNLTLRMSLKIFLSCMVVGMVTRGKWEVEVNRRNGKMCYKCCFYH